jgi:hypothetical protein
MVMTGKSRRGRVAWQALIIAALFWSISAAAAEEQSSGNYWKALCDQPQYDYACAYYINGVVDGLMLGVTETSMISRSTANKVYGYCPPTTTSVGDMKPVSRSKPRARSVAARMALSQMMIVVQRLARG